MKDATFAPAYVAIYPVLCEVARQHGYALAIHGSASRDLDLIAVPWTNAAVPAAELVQALANAVDVDLTRHLARSDAAGVFTAVPMSMPTQKPHGRLAWTLQLLHPQGRHAYIDLSVLPLHPDT